MAPQSFGIALQIETLKMVNRPRKRLQFDKVFTITWRERNFGEAVARRHPASIMRLQRTF